MTAPAVLYDTDGRVARITLNRPERLNAVDEAMPSATHQEEGRRAGNPYHLTPDHRGK